MSKVASRSQNLELLATEMIADHLARRVLGDHPRPRLWLFPGYDGSLVEQFVGRLQRAEAEIEIKVDPEYAADAHLPSSCFLDRQKERFTQYRNRRERHTVLMPKNAYGQEWESLEAVETVEQEDLRNQIDEFVEALPRAEGLFGAELVGLTTFMRRLVRMVNPTLQECLEYILAVHELRRNGIPTKEAMGESLPRLGAFRYRDAFGGLKLADPKAKTIDNVIRRAVEQSRNSAEKLSPSGSTFTVEELLNNLQAAGDVISEPVLPTLERFVTASVRDDEARAEALELDWVEDGVQFVFQRPRKVSRGLGERTLAHLEHATVAALQPTDKELLQQMDKWRSISDTNRPRLERFYTRFQPHIELAPKLNDGWRRLLYKQDVRELDFVAALIRTADDLLDPDSLSEVDYPLRLKVGAEVQTVVDILDRFSYEAVTYFATRYRGLQDLLGSAVDLDLGELEQVDKYAEAVASGQADEVPADIREEVKKFVEEDRPKEKFNQLHFQAQLFTSRGNAVDGGKKRFVWRFEHSSFLAGFGEDMRRHSRHPLWAYRMPRALSSRKGVRLPVALDEPECVDVVGDRKLGRLTSDRLGDLAEDIRQEIEAGLVKLGRENAVSSGQCEQVRSVLAELDELLRDTFRSYLAEGLAWEGWEDFAQRYANMLDRLASAGHGSRYAEEVLAPIATVGTACVSEEDALIVSPTHPLRLLSLWVKAEQAAAVLRRWLVHPNLVYVDRDMYIKTLLADLRHPYYPEILTDSNRSLLATSATLADYSLLTNPQGASDLDGSANNDNPDDAARLLVSIAQDYLNLHPHERHNLSIMSHSVASHAFPQVLTEAFNAPTNRNLGDARAQLLIRDVNSERLRTTYRDFLGSIEPEGKMSDMDAPLASRVSVTALAAPEAADLGSGDVDIAFLLDHVAARATVHWRSAHVEVDRPSLTAHYPARWGRRTVHDPADNFSASYLCCPVNPAVVDSFHHVIRAAVAPQAVEAADGTPVRQVDYADTQIKNSFDEAHHLAQWVVNYDSVLDRRQLSQLDIDVIRYRPSFEEGRNLVISSKQPNYVVLDHIRRRLERMGLLSEDIDPHYAVRRVWEAANTLSGGLILRAAGQGYFVNELIGAVLSKELLKQMVPTSVADHAIWVYLDDYSSWFRHNARIAGELSQVEKKAIADVLCIVPERIDGRLVLRILLSEAKVIESASNISQAEERSRTQLRASYEKFGLITSAVQADDQEAWRLRLGNLLVNAGQRSDAVDLDPEEIRSLIHADKVEFKLEGHSHIFCGDPGISPSKRPISATGNAWQWTFPRDEFRSIFVAFVHSQHLDAYSLVNEAPPEDKDAIPSKRPSPKMRENGQETVAPPTQAPSSSPRDIEKIDEASQTDAPSGIVAPDEIITRFSRWARPSVAEFLATLREQIASGEDELDIEQQLRDTETAMKEFFPGHGIRTELGHSTITPNAFRVRIRGQHGLTAAKLEKHRDELLTLKGLTLTHIETEPGYYALSFLRRNRSPVFYLDCLDDRTVTSVGNNTSILLGRREDTGDLLYYDFGQADSHALIGGMSNSGKSALLSLIIADLILTNDPDNLRLILVDPKQVEFVRFRNVPHLYGYPIVRTKEDALQVLVDLIQEMERRYQLMADAGVNNIKKYNEKHVANSLPRIVLVFDEFADWMLDHNFKASENEHFQRLAGMARAAGIHLILSTQRPDNSVVSPILRANLGAKIALRVDKEANSEITLDEGGAERLLGAGHGIARLSGERCMFQSAFIDDELLDHIVDHLGGLYPAKVDYER